MSMFAAYLGCSVTMANPRICIHNFDRTRGLWPQCRSAGPLRDSNIATKAPKMNARNNIYKADMVEESEELLSAVGLA